MERPRVIPALDTPFYDRVRLEEFQRVKNKNNFASRLFLKLFPPSAAAITLASCVSQTVQPGIVEHNLLPTPADLIETNTTETPSVKTPTPKTPITTEPTETGEVYADPTREKVHFRESPDLSKTAKTIQSINTLKHEIVCTIDDGFIKEYVEKMLAIIKKYKISCTFFAVGERLIQFPYVWQEAAAYGIDFGSHTQNHYDLTVLPDSSVRLQINESEKSARKVLGVYFESRYVRYLRMPSRLGHWDPRLKRIAYEEGYEVIADWTVENIGAVLCEYDSACRPKTDKDTVDSIKADILKNIISKAKNGAIMAWHFNLWEAEAFEDTIRELIRMGFAIKPLPRGLEK